MHWPRCGVSAFYLYYARTLFLFLYLISVLHPRWGSPGDVLSAFEDPMILVFIALINTVFKFMNPELSGGAQGEAMFGDERKEYGTF